MSLLAKVNSNSPVVSTVDQITKNKDKLESLVNIIFAGHKAFLEKKDISTLPECTNALCDLEYFYKRLYRLDREQALKFKETLDQVRKLVQEMNMGSNTVTAADIAHIRTFFNRPVEDVYIDKENGHKKYIQPDHSHLLEAAALLLLKGEYTGYGLLREQRIQGKMCDIVYVIKGSDQVKYEVKSKSKNVLSGMLSCVCSQQDPDMQARINKQQQLLKANEKNISELCERWKYKKFLICNKDDLISLGRDKKSAIKNQVIIFYYQEINDLQLT